ncbi:MAG: 6-hydroxymethylpterin diphosphokinase MptE-like protein [Oscillospiraceae bacterium]
MNIWPINKIKSIFSSIDQQLKERAKSEEMLQIGINKIAEKQVELATALGDLAKKEENLEKQRIVLAEQQKSNSINKEQNYKSVLEELNKAIFNINDRFYHSDLEFVELQMQICEMKVPGNLQRYANLENFHKGETCFIIGNGPSLKMEDLSKLKEKGIVTFASNRIYECFEQTNWRPTYFITQDFKMLLSDWDYIEKFKDFTCFYPQQMVTEKNKVNTNQNIVFFPLKYRNPFPIWFSNNPSKIVHEGMTVTFSAMQIAAFMGFSKVYLLGVDCNYPTVTNENGEQVIDFNQQTHFTKNYWHKGESIYNPDLTASKQAYESAKKYSEDHDIKFYNATRGGMLETFERVSFDETMLLF